MSINELKGPLRDINLDFIMNDPSFKIDISKRYNTKFRIFYPSRKLIRCVFRNGGVLTGSRALRCYTLQGSPILNRKVTDWDFVVTLEQAFKICSEMNINEIPRINDVISVNNQRMWRHPEYSDSYRVGPVDVQLIIREELPTFTEIRGIRISDFGYSISHKVQLVNDLESKKSRTNYYDEYTKHIVDLNQIIIKFNALTKD